MRILKRGSGFICRRGWIKRNFAGPLKGRLLTFRRLRVKSALFTAVCLTVTRRMKFASWSPCRSRPGARRCGISRRVGAISHGLRLTGCRAWLRIVVGLIGSKNNKKTGGKRKWNGSRLFCGASSGWSAGRWFSGAWFSRFSRVVSMSNKRGCAVIECQ